MFYTIYTGIVLIYSIDTRIYGHAARRLQGDLNDANDTRAAFARWPGADDVHTRGVRKAARRQRTASGWGACATFYRLKPLRRGCLCPPKSPFPRGNRLPFPLLPLPVSPSPLTNSPLSIPLLPHPLLPHFLPLLPSRTFSSHPLLLSPSRPSVWHPSPLPLEGGAYIFGPPFSTATPTPSFYFFRFENPRAAGNKKRPGVYQSVLVSSLGEGSLPS